MRRGGVKKGARVNFGVILILGFLIILGIAIVGALSWKVDMETEYFGEEDALPTAFYYNFSNETEGLEEGMVFYILSEDNIKSSNPLHTGFSMSDFYWIYWNDTMVKSDSFNGILVIDSTNDNETGKFNITIGIQENNETQIIKPLKFTINATNDIPEFTDILDYYNFSLGDSTTYYLNASDEENHFPLIFNISFIEDNCTHGVATGLGNNQNCNLFDEFFNMSFNSSFTNTSAKISFTPNLSHIGVYWANVSVIDSGENYNCSAEPYCAPDYSNNQTTYYSQLVKFEVLYDLIVNASDCNNSVFNDTGNFLCWINISTIGELDLLNITNNILLNGFSTPSYVNQSWFFANFSDNAENFNYALLINVTPGKEEVGNWSINFSVSDENLNQESEIIYIYVNKTSENTAPQLTSIENQTVSIDSNNTFYFNITDDDSLIPDKRIYNESFTLDSLNYSILNASNLSQEIDFSSFAISYYGSGLIEGTNVTKMKITFSPNSTEYGNFIINLTIIDNSNEIDSTSFNLTVIDNTAPSWWNVSTSVYLNTSSISVSETGFNFYLNLTNSSNGYFWANDSDNDILTFSNSSTAPLRFNLTSGGVINFTPWKQDVGNWTFNLTVSDGYLSDIIEVVFNIARNNSAPNITSLQGTNITTPITSGSSANASEDDFVTLSLQLVDYDFLITSGYYNESLDVNTLLTNLSAVNQTFSINFTFLSTENNISFYEANFTPNKNNVGVYNVTINVTDKEGLSDLFYFNLTILEINHAPEIDEISNQSLVIEEVFYLDINATDTEDIDDSYGNLTYFLNFISGSNFSGGNESIFNTTLGIFNFTFNESQAGIYEINVSVNDSEGAVDWQIFRLSVYGFAELLSPAENSVFNFSEMVAGNFTFAFNHSVSDNLTYEFWVDNITCSYQNSSNRSYSDLFLVSSGDYTGNGSSFNRSWTPNYYDETYNNLKNLTLKVYPANENLNSTQKESIAANFSFKLNISHTNAPVELLTGLPNPYPSSVYGATPLTITLSQYFRDIDYFDEFYQQNVTFNITTNATESIIMVGSSDISNQLPWNGTVSGWSLRLYSSVAGTEDLKIIANDSFSEESSSFFVVTFTAPTSTPPSGGSSPSSSSGGSTTLLKLFAIRIIVPQDIIISNENFIEIPFTLQNTGEIDLKGINLTSIVLFNNLHSDDVKIFMEPVYVSELKIGETQNLTMRITANTQKEGRYKATVYANVASPKFFDWGDFFIDLRKTNDTDAERVIIFTEKLIAENPECLELTEILNNAKDKLSKGEIQTAMDIAEEVSSACEKAVKANEQIRFKLKNSVTKNFYYIFFATLLVLLLGFIIYIYKRVKFNK
jgi:hypothetical protein